MIEEFDADLLEQEGSRDPSSEGIERGEEEEDTVFDGREDVVMVEE